MSEENKPEFDLNKHTARLLMNEPFFAGLSRRIDKRKTTDIPTAGVTVDPKSAQFVLLYNPDYFAKLTDKEKLGVLKHEFYHLVFEHVTGRKPEGGLTREDNMCMDLAINSHLINELPDNCCIPGQKPFEWAPVGKTYEWYKRIGKGWMSKKAKAVKVSPVTEKVVRAQETQATPLMITLAGMISITLKMKLQKSV